MFLNNSRVSKPRDKGLTIIIDNGLPFKLYEDYIFSYSEYIDYIKFGWGSSLLTKFINKKISLAKEFNIKCFLGGSFFEKAVINDKFSSFIKYVKNDLCLESIEISNGTIDINNKKKCIYIKQLSGEFNVFSEVGYKDEEKSLNLYPKQWIEFIEEDLKAGSKYVIAESRETGNSGICRSDGQLRYGLVKEICDSKINQSNLVWEAPNKDIQVNLINNVGVNVNLANISFADIIPLESLREGLRSDTLLRVNNNKNMH